MIKLIRKDIEKAGAMKVMSIAEVDFSHKLLTEQQKKVFSYAYEHGYYEIRRKTKIEDIVKELKLSRATVGEHLLRAENKIIQNTAKKL